MRRTARRPRGSARPHGRRHLPRALRSKEAPRAQLSEGEGAAESADGAPAARAHVDGSGSDTDGGGAPAAPVVRGGSLNKSDFKISAVSGGKGGGEGGSVIKLKLKINNDGHCSTVNFAYDPDSDKPAAVAAEMVAALELTPDDEAPIATEIDREISKALVRAAGDARASEDGSVKG